MATILSTMEDVYTKWERRAVQNKSSDSVSFLSKSSQFSSGGLKTTSITKRRQTWKNRSLEMQRKSRHAKIQPLQLAPVSAILGDFKRTPSIATHTHLYQRPVTDRCCHCMPISRDTFVHANEGIPNITNILRLPYMSCKHSPLLRPVCHLYYTYNHTVRFGYPNITDAVLRSHCTQLAVEKTVQEELAATGETLDENSKRYKNLRKKCANKLKTMFSDMKAVMSIPIFKVTGWVLHKVLGSLLNSIQVQDNQLMSLKEASMTGKPIIYLPMHRSHLDYVLITFILWHYGLRAPYVAAGNNLNIPVFGHILRSLGAFFIRRRLDKEEGKKDYLYRSVLNEYVEVLLRAGQSMEFFIEGGRSRSGKALMPKAGLLSIIVDYVLASRMESDGIMRQDALIVPVSISYEKIMDGNFVREQMGQPKQAESFWKTLRAIWKLFSTTFGNVRVDFSQPFSLKEYLSVNKVPLVAPAYGGRANSPPGIHDSTGDLLQLHRATSDSSIYGIDVAKEEQRAVVDSLAKHVIYNCICNTAVMSTNLVAFVLLQTHRQAVTMTKLIQSIDKLRQYVISANRDLGFVGQTCDIIAHAVRLLGSHLISVELNNEQLDWYDLYDASQFDEITIWPIMTVEASLELSFYSNPVITVFQLPALLACALCSAARVPLLDSCVTGNAEAETLVVSKEQVINKALFLAELLQHEFLFTAPCKSLEAELVDSWDNLVTSDLLRAPGAEDTFNEEAQQWTSRVVAKSLYAFSDGEDDSDYGFLSQDIKYQVNYDQLELLKMYIVPLQPFIESYWFLTCQLYVLLDKDIPADDFSHLVHNGLIRRIKSGVAQYVESIAMDTLKNALHSLSDMKVTNTYTAAGERMISLTDRYSQKSELDRLIADIDSYRAH